MAVGSLVVGCDEGEPVGVVTVTDGVGLSGGAVLRSFLPVSPFSRLNHSPSGSHMTKTSTGS